MDDKTTDEREAHLVMKDALKSLSSAVGSRENALAKTKLEEAIMWNNKDRAIKGELEKSETFV